jgi:SOS-response transcriptional repressor LexA
VIPIAFLLARLSFRVIKKTPFPLTGWLKWVAGHQICGRVPCNFLVSVAGFPADKNSIIGKTPMCQAEIRVFAYFFGKKMEINGRFAQIRESLRLNKRQFADSLGINQSVAGDIELGKREPSREVMLKLATTYKININWLLTGDGQMILSPKVEKPAVPEKHPLVAELEKIINQNMKIFDSRLSALEAAMQDSDVPDFSMKEPEPAIKVWYVNGIAAGPPIDQLPDESATIFVPSRFIKTKPEDYYAACVKGESMTQAGIPSNSIVLIKKNDIPRDGAIQVVQCQGRSTLKRVRKNGDSWLLCYEDDTDRYIQIAPDAEYTVQGDFVAVIPGWKLVDMENA